MLKFVSLSFLVSSLIFVATFAAESAGNQAVEGTWLLTKSVDGKEVDTRSGVLSSTPEGVGFVYLDDGEFRVPGERSGSRRFTLPKGFHFRIEPKSIGKNSAVADLLLSYTDLKSESENGFLAEKHQTDGRYKISFNKSCTATLNLAELKTKYILKVKLRGAR